MSEKLRELAELTERLILRDQYLRQFIKCFPTPVAMMDTNKKYLLCSEAWARQYKLNTDSVAGIQVDVSPCRSYPWYNDDGTLGGEIIFSETKEEMR